MVAALTLLLLCQLAGEALARATGLPVPGPVLGLLLLLLLLALRQRLWQQPPWPALKSTANGFIANLTLLYVPAGVGLMVHLDRLAADWLPLLAALIGSTLVTLVVTALVFRGVSRLVERPAGEP